MIIAVDKIILMMAVRYALGRKTYAIDIVVEHLINHWNCFTHEEKKQIKSEIRKTIKEHNFGWVCDKKSWQMVLTLGD